MSSREWIGTIALSCIFAAVGTGILPSGPTTVVFLGLALVLAIWLIYPWAKRQPQAWKERQREPLQWKRNGIVYQATNGKVGQLEERPTTSSPAERRRDEALRAMPIARVHSESEQIDDSETETAAWLTATDGLREGWAKHRQCGDSVELWVRNLRPFMALESFYCVVEDPNGVMSWVKADVNAAGSAKVMYPFEESPDPVDGDYVVRWVRRGLATAVLRPPPAATDEFSIRRGRLVR